MKDINVTRSSMPPYEEYCEEIQSLWENRWLTNMGEKHKQLQKELNRYLEVQHTELLCNGHMAIELSLLALDLRGEVITTPFTFVSTTQAIVRNGLTPVFCDIDPVTFTMDPSKIESLITEQTTAIVPVHVYGNICDVEEISRIAKKYNLKVLYDAAHAFGVRQKGHGIGIYGDVSCFSFHATKVFHTIEGGAVCFHNKKFGRKLECLKNFGFTDSDDVEELGVNAKLDEFRAAMGLCNLRYVDGEIAKRKKIVERYREHLQNIQGLQLNPIQSDIQTNYAYFPVVFDEVIFGVDRDEILKTLAAHGINARKYFYPLTSTLSCYRGRYRSVSTPIAQWISQRVLTLPLYADMDEETVDRICNIILGCQR